MIDYDPKKSKRALSSKRVGADLVAADVAKIGGMVLPPRIEEVMQPAAPFQAQSHGQEFSFGEQSQIPSGNNKKDSLLSCQAKAKLSVSANDVIAEE